MARLFPPAIKYECDFKPEDLSSHKWERTQAQRKIISYVPQFTGDGVEELLYTGRATEGRFIDAMNAQSIPVNQWQDQFRLTLHGDPVFVEGDADGDPFAENEEGFNNNIVTNYIKKYVADPNAKETLLQALNTDEI
ncbi:hypothetical protein FRACYDRAFT_232189 [Fragilariopsis cylindrus CCMP1102]|uniref:Uncharacterized protein n=1 Tax=Fragilariopsis cylindrus CCMP1102 TaxID=635003 RepID=A0A1E7FV80_9STRA|nr:hypothetical protein FRACYDRAFT_232189 [Fragilariopsis cylindrus CCMP1102]|eukprot:OEU22034.1 hypothetical protein FRACYDRAFT_232189 [Fragilariopsis cylindrus CCMP1102]